MPQPTISDYEATDILQEINRLSYHCSQNHSVRLLQRHQDNIAYWVGYLEKRGRYVKRIHASPVVYTFVGSVYDPERITTAEHFIAETDSSRVNPKVMSIFSKFDETLRQLKCKVPQPRFNYSEEIRRFVFFLQSLNLERRIETMQYVINLVFQEVEEEANHDK